MKFILVLISDVSTLKNVILKQKELNSSINNFILDRGFYSASNIDFMFDNKIDFIIPLLAHFITFRAFKNKPIH